MATIPRLGALVFAAALTCCLALAALQPAPSRALTRDRAVAALVREVTSRGGELKATMRHLTGAVVISVHGESGRAWTRYGHSGKPLRLAQEYVHARLAAFGLRASYQSYGAGTTERNVIGEIRGTTQPGEIVVVGAHLDDMPASGRAPGADDNGSGSSALMYLARHLAGHRFKRTIRFVFFSGEEIGGLGSSFAAQQARDGDEHLAGVLILDCVGWNARGSRVVEVHRRKLDSAPGSRADLAVARMFERVIVTYGIIGIRARDQADGRTWSDHTSFWAEGFGAAWVSEDMRPFANPAWHSRYDTPGRLSWGYLQSVTSASLAAVAHMARIETAASPSGKPLAGRTLLPIVLPAWTTQ